MSIETERVRRRALMAKGERHLSMWIDAETSARLRTLVQYHRLDQREIFRRLILDIPLGASEVNPMGLSPDERMEYEKQLRERHD